MACVFGALFADCLNHPSAKLKREGDQVIQITSAFIRMVTFLTTKDPHAFLREMRALGCESKGKKFEREKRTGNSSWKES